MIQELYKYVDTDFVLCTQWDAFILNPDAWTNEFLCYDFLGSPWWWNDDKNIGNGGGSLRSKRYLEVCSLLPLKNFHPEDLVLNRVYKNLLVQKGIKYPPEELAARFGIEGNIKYGQKWTNQFLFHDLEMTDISNWKGYNEFIRS